MGSMRNQYNLQLDRIERREARLFREGMLSASQAGLLERVETKIPERLADTMERAFCSAFQLLFQKGTRLLGRTIQEERLQTERQVGEYFLRRDPSARNVRAFHRRGTLSGAATSAVATAEGCALGFLGMGLPDIPILLSILLRAVYQTAVRYGFHYDTPEEQYYILLLLCAALSRGPERAVYSGRADDFGRRMDHGEIPAFALETQIQETASVLSKAMLVVKFIQGAPVLGLVGGLSNFSASRSVTEVAGLKYQKRFLEKKRRGL